MMDQEGLIPNKIYVGGGKGYDTSRYPENWYERATRKEEPAVPTLPNNPGGSLDGWGKVADRCPPAIEKRDWGRYRDQF